MNNLQSINALAFANIILAWKRPFPSLLAFLVALTLFVSLRTHLPPLSQSPVPQQPQKTPSLPRKMSSATAGIRPISQVIKGQKMMEGAGVRICRTIGVGGIRVDPFLMLDELRLPAAEASSGFPDHPHRGMSTVSIMLSGKMEHWDSMGNKGVIGPGGVQYMTAGRGIIHSEMPVVTSGDLHGFQLWINLAAKDKMCKPRYQDIQKEEIPTVATEAGSIRVMAGTVGETVGPVKLKYPGLLLDVNVEAGKEIKQRIPSDWNAFAYVYEGGSGSRLSGQSVSIQHSYVFGTDGDEIVATAGKDQGLKFLLFAAKPTNEEIVQHGPFVMNSPLEIQQAFADYRSGKFQNPDDDVWAADSDDGEL
ncbi:putative Pirin-like protein [Nannochloris sp. 'desiccata']|nr:putative Pirin-like protein [Chlorella desiccata (nom. nud.)]